MEYSSEYYSFQKIMKLKKLKAFELEEYISGFPELSPVTLPDAGTEKFLTDKQFKLLSRAILLHRHQKMEMKLVTAILGADKDNSRQLVDSARSGAVVARLIRSAEKLAVESEELNYRNQLICEENRQLKDMIVKAYFGTMARCQTLEDSVNQRLEKLEESQNRSGMLDKLKGWLNLSA